MRNSQWEKVWSCETLGVRAYPNIHTESSFGSAVVEEATVNSHLSFWWPFERALIHVGRFSVFGCVALWWKSRAHYYFNLVAVLFVLSAFSPVFDNLAGLSACGSIQWKHNSHTHTHTRFDSLNPNRAISRDVLLGFIWLCKFHRHKIRNRLSSPYSISWFECW